MVPHGSGRYNVVAANGGDPLPPRPRPLEHPRRCASLGGSCQRRVSSVHKLAVAPREILGLAVPSLDSGEAANLTVFDDTTEWTLEARHLKSKSKNTPFVGDAMVGRAWAVVNKGLLVEAEA